MAVSDSMEVLTMGGLPAAARHDIRSDERRLWSWRGQQVAEQLSTLPSRPARPKIRRYISGRVSGMLVRSAIDWAAQAKNARRFYASHLIFGQRIVLLMSGPCVESAYTLSYVLIGLSNRCRH
jgi:hypothetical protein